MQNTQIILAQRPSGMVMPQHFNLQTADVPQLNENEFIVQVQYISLDPAMRGWMNEGTTYIKGVAIGEVMRAFAAGVVLQSTHAGFAVGSLVQGMFGVQTYTISNGIGVTLIPPSSIPLSWYLGILGMPGLTAYYGLLAKGMPVAGNVVLVSGAAGMVGSLVGQIAMLHGCTVIGIAGSNAKCDYLKQELHFNEVINYKTDDVNAAIKKYAPNGVNIYFDNVGGAILDAALLNLAYGARVVICGAIAQYNDVHFNGLKNYMKIVSARASLCGIIVLDYFDRADEAITQLTHWLQVGKIKYQEHRVTGIDNFATTLQMLFTGENNGKLILEI